MVHVFQENNVGLESTETYERSEKGLPLQSKKPTDNEVASQFNTHYFTSKPQYLKKKSESTINEQLLCFETFVNTCTDVQQSIKKYCFYHFHLEYKFAKKKIQIRIFKSALSNIKECEFRYGTIHE